VKPRLALFVLEALPNARAARRFVEDHASEIAFVGLSNAERPNMGGFFGQLRRHLKRSGPGFLPYLAINFGLPDLLRALHPLAAALGRPGATAMPMEAFCRQRGLPTLWIDDVNGPAVAAAFAQHRPDLIVAFHFDQIFSAGTLERAPLGGVNVHPGLLPRHRGPVPTIHALAEPTPAFGVTVHRLVARIDVGSILAQEALALPADTSASQAAVRLHDHGRGLLDGVLDTIARTGMPEGRPMPVLPYCPFPDRALLRRLRGQGRRIADGRDLRDALTLYAARKGSDA
jgi:folate-dependent phosphoribosylglycinamide formyltransferase PurN